MAKRQAGIYIGEVEGREEALKILNDLKPRLYNELVERVREEAEAVADAVNRAMPNSAPMSGFVHGGRTSWAEKGEASAKAQHTLVQTGSGTAEWPVYKISLGGYASAVADIAGAAGASGASLEGANMIAVLNSRVGRASRWVWPVAKRHEAAVVRKMEAACDKVEADLSLRLGQRKD